MELHVTKSYRFMISGIGITQVALGCCIFSLGFGVAGIAVDDLSQFQTPYITITLVTGMLIILSGAICHCTAKKATPCYLFLILITSSLSIVFSLTLLGIQSFLTGEYTDAVDHSPLTMASLVIGSMSAAVSFFASTTAIAITCTAGGACGSSNSVAPSSEDLKTSAASIQENV